MKELNVFTGKKVAANIVKVADGASKIKALAENCQNANSVRKSDLVRLNAAVRKLEQSVFAIMKEAEAQKAKASKG